MISMGTINALMNFSRLSLHTIRQSITRGISTTNNVSPLCFRATNILFGEPLKKKKKIDPAIIRQREERKRRKLEKQIRRLEKHARQLKPIGELEIPFKLVDEKMKRTRNKIQVSPDVLEKRMLLGKKWAQYRKQENAHDMQMIDNVLRSQKRALDELQVESEELYRAAIQVDISSLLPHLSNGPAATVYTPPIPGYSSPDGNYSNISIKFDGDKMID